MLLREDFEPFWRYRSAHWAGLFLDRWCTRVRRSRIEPMKKVARSLRTHRALLLNWCKARGQISAGAVEGLNNKAKLTTRKAYGFRTYLSGDSGRDGTFFAPEGDEIAFQYSISQDWRQKIRRTVERLNKQFPGSVRVLVYVSNCRIGADADEFKQELQREHGVHLDVRDENWFIERVNSNAERQEAAEELARVIVDPFLAGEGVIARKAQALTGLEARTGLLYLEVDPISWTADRRR